MNPNSISSLTLRLLLYELRDRRPDICVRFRLMGEMWQTNCLRICSMSDRGVILIEDGTGQIITIPDLNHVIQFEIDHAFQGYQPHFHYQVEPAFATT